MKQAVLANWDLPWLPVTALIIFVVCFAAYTYWTFRKKNKGHYEDAARVPLEDARVSKKILKGH